MARSEFMLQKAVAQCQFNIGYCLFIPSSLHLLSLTGICETFVSVAWTVKLNPLVFCDVLVPQKQQKQDESLLLAAHLMSLPLPFVMALLWSLAKQVCHQCWSSAAYALYAAMNLLIAPIACFHWWSGVRCRPCRCRRVWRETCSSVCKPSRASSDRIWAKEPNGRSSGSKKSEMSHMSYQTKDDGAQ